MNRDSNNKRFGITNPCGEKDCIVCNIEVQMLLDIDKELIVDDWFNKNLNNWSEYTE